MLRESSFAFYIGEKTETAKISACAFEALRDAAGRVKCFLFMAMMYEAMKEKAAVAIHFCIKVWNLLEDTNN